MTIFWRNSILLIFAVCAFLISADGQVRRELSVAKGGSIEIVNRYGKVEVIAVTDENTKPTLSTTARIPISDNEVAFNSASSSLRIEIKPNNKRNRVDVTLSLPTRTKLKILTADGEISVSGNFESVEAATETGTIAADVPTDDIRYEMLWTESRPRYLSDLELEKVKEGSGGKFSMKGRYRSESTTTTSEAPGEGNGSDEKPEPTNISLNFTTARGIILLNVPPNEVMSDLRERPLTDAAKAIIRSGDTVLMDAIRRASPKYFGDYSKTLGPYRREPGITVASGSKDTRGTNTKVASVRVTDMQNRAVSSLTKDDFEVTESGEKREVISAKQTTSSVNLVLLLDVSGSVDNYVNFIRKAARAFVETVDRNDKVSIIIFNEDVKTIAGFTTDKGKLSESLDTFDAGGGTAYFDAIAYTLSDTLRPLRGERTAIVVLTDGDDNRSFLPFDSLVGAIEESGALIYPLYVPTSLIAAASSDPSTTVDPLRSRYMNNDLTSKADGEGRRLAQISGGVYYPITQLSQIQTAYEDIVVQLRTSYDVTFRSELTSPDNRPSPRLKFRTTKPNTFVQVRSVTVVP